MFNIFHLSFENKNSVQAVRWIYDIVYTQKTSSEKRNRNYAFRYSLLEQYTFFSGFFQREFFTKIVRLFLFFLNNQTESEQNRFSIYMRK